MAEKAVARRVDEAATEVRAEVCAEAKVEAGARPLIVGSLQKGGRTHDDVFVTRVLSEDTWKSPAWVTKNHVAV